MKVKTCKHLEAIETFIKPDKPVCKECVKEGTDWVKLRTCQTCGVTLCCDSSPQKHARQHFKQTGHPVIKSAEPGESWMWCYEDELYKKVG
jgi:uncharacterized UBP type Zn finger protein